MNKTIIEKTDPASAAALEMMQSLWDELQTPYGYDLPGSFPPLPLIGKGTCFRTAKFVSATEGSVAILPCTDIFAELDLVYVRPSVRGTGVAFELSQTTEAFACSKGYTTFRLRTGKPQPEDVKFYIKYGYSEIRGYGRPLDNETAVCYEKFIHA